MEQITIAAIINEQNTTKNNDSSFSSLNVTAVNQSTPIKYFQTSEACSTPDYKKYSTPSNTGYKPKVNFHSIADLASPCNESGYSSNDSQMQSMNNTPQLASTHRPKVEYEVGKESDKKPIRTTFSDLQKQQLESQMEDVLDGLSIEKSKSKLEKAGCVGVDLTLKIKFFVILKSKKIYCTQNKV